MCADQAPVRPSLPPALWLAAAVWVGVLASESWSWRAYASAVHPSVAPAIAAALGLAGSWLLRRHGLGALLAAGLCAGILTGSLFWIDWDCDVSRLGSMQNARWSAEVLCDAVSGQFGERSSVALEGGSRVSALWGAGVEPPDYGERVEFFGRPRPPATDDFGRIAHQRGDCGTIQARYASGAAPARSLRGLLCIPRRAACRALARVPGPGGALLSGVVTGDRRRIKGTALESDFRVTGLSHLIAVSGSHLVVVAAVGGWLLSRLRTRRMPAAIALAATLGAYVVFTGVQPSALRAWAMSCLLVGAQLGFRRADGLAGLGAGCCVLLCSWPPCAFDVGFRLSVLAVTGLMTFGRLGESWVRCCLPRFLRGVAPPVSMALVAQASTLPVSIPTFGVVSVVSPLANVVAGPLIAVSLAGGLAGLAACLLSEAAGHAVLMAAGATANACAVAAAALARIPHACILLGANAPVATVVCVAVGTAIWLAWPAPRKLPARVVVAAVAILMGAPAQPGQAAQAGTSVSVLDVGQGDAILVRSRGESMLVDLGPDERSMRAALLRTGVRDLDWVVVTHAHADHDGGAGALNGTVTIDNVGFSSADGEIRDGDLRNLAEKAGRTIALRAGDSFEVGDVAVRVMWPPADLDPSDENQASIVLALDGEAMSVLLAGDAESEVLEKLRLDGLLGDVDAIKIGHHGSAGAVSPETLGVLSPEVAMVSVGTGNRFGHPAPSTLGELRDAGCRVSRTDLDGDLRLAPGASGPELVCQPVAAARSRVRN